MSSGADKTLRSLRCPFWLRRIIEVFNGPEARLNFSNFLQALKSEYNIYQTSSSLKKSL
jgi:hypothetical protein